MEEMTSNKVIGGDEEHHIHIEKVNGSEDDVLLVNQNGTSQRNKEATPIGSKKVNIEEDCILLDDEDDDVRVIDEPGIPKSNDRSNTPQGSQPTGDQSRSPVPEDPKNSKESTPVRSSLDEDKNKKTTDPIGSNALTSYSDLLSRLELFIKNAINKDDNVERKVLDALLSAINIQVQKEPYAVRKLILEKKLILPNTISVPPSQVVELLIEHDPDNQLSRVINRLFGEERPKLSENEKKERQILKAMHPAPHMTKLLLEIGQDLVQESTYYDIVHARNLPEMPKNMDTYKQVAAQLKPVWEGLKAKNEPFKMKYFACHVCNFKTESRTVLNAHLQTLHYIGRRYQCTLCPEFDTNEHRLIKHILEEHGVRPVLADTISTIQCPICEEEFHYKGQRDSHLRLCRRDLHKLRTIQSGHSPEHISMINRWLWEKPPSEPSILSQQQETQRQVKQQFIKSNKITTSANIPNSANFLTQSRSTLLAAGGTLPANRSFSQQSIDAMQQRLKMITQTTMGNTATSLQPSVGQILRMAREKGQNITPQMIQAAMQSQLMQQQQKLKSQQILAAAAAKIPQPTSVHQQRNIPTSRSLARTSMPTLSAFGSTQNYICEICDFSQLSDRDQYRIHMQNSHRQLLGKKSSEMANGAPLACSRCRDRFWTYEGLERHLVMVHGLVTADLLAKAQKKADSGKCKICMKQYAFNILQHLVSDHQIKLCSAEIMYSCDVCSYRCTSYQKLEKHLEVEHPNNNK